ncbi:MAG: asparaginase [Rhodomicrobium sp.]
MNANPVLIEVTRGPAVESRHRGAFVVVDAAGKVIWGGGDSEMPVYPRSAAKPLQALPLIETGAADRFNLTNRELALACASHKGEPAHVAAVEAWLACIGLDPTCLECGVQAPRTAQAAEKIVRDGTPLNAAYHNCSGKHTGFLTTCMACGDPVQGYIEPGHPAQKRVTQALAEMTGCDLWRVSLGRDGCGIPVYCMPLQSLALGMARLADPAQLPRPRALAASRLLDAIAAEPFYVNGTNGFTTEAMLAAPQTVRVKGGAEGVYAAALPTKGFGVALKIDDGGMRAAECAMAHILRALDCFSADEEARLGPFLSPLIMTNAGREAGAIKPTSALQEVLS